MKRVITLGKLSIQIEDKISQGQFGVVYRGRNVDSLIIRLRRAICHKAVTCLQGKTSYNRKRNKSA